MMIIVQLNTHLNTHLKILEKNMSEKFSNNPFAEPLKNFIPEKAFQLLNIKFGIGN